MTNIYNKTAKQQFQDMLSNCPWFDSTKHFVVAIEDDNGNIEEIVGAGSTFQHAKPALELAWDVVYEHYDNNYSVTLYEGGMLRSYTL
jgi:hypothetical protein